VLLIQKLFTHEWARKQLRAAYLAYDYEKSEYVLDYDDGVNGVIPKTMLGKPTPVRFEGYEVMGVEHADAYLRNKYGDYMVVPPHDNQRQHNFFYLDYNLPFRQYQDKRSFVNRDNASR
jgi:lipopolysaccharide cholinephosphotransferase